jgi:hypothetical protein
MVDLSKLEKVETPAVLDLKAKAFSAKTYLDTTDYYVIRKLETLEEIPAGVSTKRAEARAVIKEYINATK